MAAINPPIQIALHRPAMWGIGRRLYPWVPWATPFTHMGHARRRPKRLAEKLLQIRKALGLSQKQLAKRLGKKAGVKITYNNISKYERDKSIPPIELLLAYARLANVTINQIVDDHVDLPL